MLTPETSGSGRCWNCYARSTRRHFDSQERLLLDPAPRGHIISGRSGSHQIIVITDHELTITTDTSHTLAQVWANVSNGGPGLIQGWPKVPPLWGLIGTCAGTSQTNVCRHSCQCGHKALDHFQSVTAKCWKLLEVCCLIPLFLVYFLTM